MDQETKQVFDTLKSDLSVFVSGKVELLKLEVYERIGKMISVFSYALIMIFLVFFAMLSLFMSLGFYFGGLIGSMGGGFAITFALYLLIIALFYNLRNKFKAKVLNEVITTFLTNEDEINREDKDSTLSNGDADSQEAGVNDSEPADARTSR